jgi:hypothetical protein
LSFRRQATGLLVVFLVVVAFQCIGGISEAALSKPSYTAGDRWVYVLDGSLDSFPGVNASQMGTVRFDLIGRVEVDVLGASTIVSGGSTVSTVQVETSVVGFLNGTFEVPGFGKAEATGTFSSHASEFWEDGSYLPIQSNTTTSYVADITLGITVPLDATFRVKANTSATAIPPFDLDVGQNATAALQTHLVANSTVTFAGRTQETENRTDVPSLWRREVLSREPLTVEAGTFTVYRLNQTLGSFPGLGGSFSAGSNETAYFSNETGYYVKRDAYANGTRVAELRLKSYSYGARTSSFDLINWVLLVAAGAIGFVLVLLYLKRRKGRIPEPPSGGSQSTTVELKGGGNNRAH